ncbi:MAG: type IV pilus assembly protein PilM [Candidatus Pacebacteria bacterium]|nr:type IV pilus assembly protein PilM [Candidatus Paceibacterota bacterium]
MFNLLKLHSNAFGLDFSDSSIKIIKLNKKGKNFGLSCFKDFALEQGIIENGEIKDEATLINSIKNSISKVKGQPLKTKYVISSLPEEKAFLNVIQMPILKEQELASAIKYEAENHIPLSIKDVYLDFANIEPIHNHLDHLDVLIVGCPKKIVDSYVKVLKQADLKPIALEIESHAITRALIKNEISPFPILIIDIGANKTSFIIFSGHSIRFTSSIPISSQTFTRAISKTLKIKMNEAETIKIKHGLSKRKKDVFYSIVPVLTDLSEQIEKYIDYYISHKENEHLPPNGMHIQKVLLCGDGANLKGLSKFLSERLKMPVELGNPWINILPDPLKEVPEISFKNSLKYTTALGLALRGAKK